LEAERSELSGSTVNGMSEPDDPPVQPTVVVGYPDLAPSRPAPPSAGMARLPGQVRTLRLLLIACLALLVLSVAGLAAALTGTLSRVDELTQQVTAMGAQVEAASAQAASAAAAAARPSPSPSAAAAAAAQLTAAPALDSAVALPKGVDGSGAVLIGDANAQDVVEVYIDYQCPYCQRWEGLVGGPLIAKAVQPGSGILVKQYGLAFLGEVSSSLSPAGSSARAANAAACVLDSDGPDVFVPFSTALFAAADPSEPPGQFPVAQLTSLAKDAGASAGAISCIEGETFVPFVSATTKSGFLRGVTGTPTVVLNGKTLADSFGDADLARLVASG
jgi:protein-disulfide isomerase